MGEEKESKKKGKKDDYLEIEFSLGDLEFESKGKTLVVERTFKLLLETLQSGRLVVQKTTIEEDGDEEIETVGAEIDYEGKAEGEAPPEISLDPPPEWDELDTETPPVSEPERELEDI